MRNEDIPQDYASAFRVQSQHCFRLGSSMYGILFAALAKECVANQRFLEILAAPRLDPVADALPLRLAGTIHRLVLEGQIPEISAQYPSVGGILSDAFPTMFVRQVLEREHTVLAGLGRQVQTNEPARSVVLHAFAKWLGSRKIGRFSLYEVGSSAGLNMCFDVMPTEWFHKFDLPSDSPSLCVSRRGSDLYPIDLRNQDAVLQLKSFVWPDQRERMARLEIGIQRFLDLDLRVEQESADVWLNKVLRLDQDDLATVMFHSITWQYLTESTRENIMNTLELIGQGASVSQPLYWLRMEPAGETAALHVTMWNGAQSASTTHIANVGYHGEQFAWVDI